MAARLRGVEVRERGDGGVTVVMPPGGNRWLVGLGFGLGLPWLLVFLAGSVAAVALMPGRQTVLAVIAVNLLFAILHVVAVAGVWLAAYNARGEESVEVSSGSVVVRRSAMRLTVPLKLLRRGSERVVLLDTSLAPGKVHPRLEVRSGTTAVRFGAGLSPDEAGMVRRTLEDALARSGSSPGDGR